MITVSISINGEPILARTAVNKGEFSKGYCKYELDSGNSVFHKPEGGAVKLAKLMLDDIKEDLIK